MPTCLRLLTHCARRAASRADWIAGSNNATRIPIMAMTTSSSTSVKPRWFLFMVGALLFMHLSTELSSGAAENIELEIVIPNGCHFDRLLALGIVFGRDAFGCRRRQNGLAGRT